MIADNTQCVQCTNYLYCMKCKKHTDKIPKKYIVGSDKCKDYKKNNS